MNEAAMDRPAIAGVVLSGGASRRMGTPKALLHLGGETFLDRLIGRFQKSCSPVIVVLGYNAPAIRAGIRRSAEALFALNLEPERGMLSSLQTGLALVPADCDAVMFTPVDYPEIQESSIAALRAAFLACRAPVTAPVYAGRHGHPVCVSREIVSELLALSATAEARQVIHRYREHTQYVPVEDPGVLADIDTPEDYRALQKQPLKVAEAR